MSAAPAVDDRRFRVEGPGVLLAVAGLAAAGGPAGLAVGLLLVPGWLFLPPAYVVAVAHVLLVTVARPTVGPLALGLLEAGLVWLLVLGTTPDPVPRPGHVGALVALVVALGAIGWLGLGRFDATWPTAAILLGAIGLGAYALHRYGLVRFGLVEGTP